MIRFAIIYILLIVCTSFAADATTMQTEIFDPSFRSLKIGREDNFMSPPVIRLNSGDRIIVSFDQLGDERSYLRCRLIHCNAHWEPSEIADQEFADGFNISEVDDFAFSSNTYVHFVNYRVTIPSDNLRPLISGNYILQVFYEDDEDNVLLQARFYVSESTARINGSVTTRTDRGYNDTWQQLSIHVNADRNSVRNPYSDIYLSIEQNESPFRSVFLKHPSRVEGEEIIYEHLPGLIFPAGNEFRRFETVRASYPGLGVDSVRFENGIYHAFLTQDKRRVSSEYSYDQTQAGRFIIREYNSTDSDIGADYVVVHFSLESPEFMEADIYVDGEMTGHVLSDRYKMTYDRQSGLYSLSLPLKQGSYNYRYVAIPRNAPPGMLQNPSPIEGDMYETRNEYFVKAYRRQPGDRYDALIGDALIYSY